MSENFISGGRPSDVAAFDRETKLEPHRDDLLTLKREGYTLGQMVEFLALNGVQSTTSEVSKYLRDMS